ncbi:MAG: hypothetical protein WCG25_03210 [bacterium]
MVSPNFSIASHIFAKSSSSKFHLEILNIGTPETSDMILSTIDSDCISNVSKATDLFCFKATFVSILIAKDVFHILGRAATMISSQGLNQVK